jgi:microcin C transport system permease protein
MLRYFGRRLLLILPTFLGITVLVFGITRLVPGGPVERYIQSYQLGQEGTKNSPANKGGQRLSDAQIEKLRQYYGFDKPVLESYVDWLGKFVRLDFGKSTRYGDPVLETIVKRIPISLWFGLTALLLTYLISIPLGVSKALRHQSLYDNATSAVLFVGFALPGFVVGILGLWVFSAQLGWFPLGGFESEGFADLGLWDQIGDRVSHMTLPLVAYVVGDFAVLTMVMKNNLMENLAADYVRTAVAKGRPFRSALWRHAFRNSLIPIASGFGGIVLVFFSGSFLIEQIFNIRGMGLLGYSALMDQDYPMVMGIISITALASLVGNILGDLFVSLVDPRVAYGR